MSTSNSEVVFMSRNGNNIQTRTLGGSSMSSSRSSQTIVGNGNVQISTRSARWGSGLRAVLSQLSSTVDGNNNVVVDGAPVLDDDAVTVGAGNVQTVDIAEVIEIKSLYVDIPCDVRVCHSDQSKVSVTSYENLAHLLEFAYTQDSGMLRVSLQEGANLATDQPFVIQIEAPSLSRISVSGTTRLDLVNLDQPELSIHASGQINAKGDGGVEHLDLQVSGQAKANFHKLKAKAVSATISGQVKAKLHALESITMSVSGMGTVIVAGSPRVRQVSVSGMADVDYLD